MLRIDKRLPLTSPVAGFANLEVFTVTLGGETIELSPSKNWIQLDHYKWTARGVLPAEPAGLEVAPDHVKLLGETVRINDSAGCAKLERLFSEWLALEKNTLELARQKARHPSPSARQAQAAEAEAPPLRFQVEVDKRGQVHVHCLRGKEPLASIGLNVAGFHSLHQQGFMRKPHTVVTGALRDWVELDGELFSFEKGRNEAARLEQVLNERYVPPPSAGTGKEVALYPNLVSSTGFDIQFPVVVAGALGIHRFHLNEQSLDLLQDPQHCGLLHKQIIIKLIPPNLVFKQKTADGGEQYLAMGPENTVTMTDEDGRQRTIDLHQPLSLLRLSAAELTAVFNHPAIHKHARKASAPGASGSSPAPVAAPVPVPQPSARSAAPASPPALQEPGRKTAEPASAPAGSESAPEEVARARPPAEMVGSPPNAWLRPLLARPSLPHDWFAFLTYSKMAEWFGNSTEGSLGPCEGWFISLSEAEDIQDPAFKGIFLTGKGSLGFLNQGRMARFYHEVAFLGPRDAALEGIQVTLAAVGLDTEGRVVFIVSDDYRARFGVPETTLAAELSELRACGAVVMNAAEAIASRQPIEVVWTVPAEQADPADPQAQESTRPSA